MEPPSRARAPGLDSLLTGLWGVNEVRELQVQGRLSTRPTDVRAATVPFLS